MINAAQRREQSENKVIFQPSVPESSGGGRKKDNGRQEETRDGNTEPTSTKRIREYLNTVYVWCSIDRDAEEANVQDEEESGGFRLRQEPSSLILSDRGTFAGKCYHCATETED